MPRCKVCKKGYERQYPLQNCCSVKCAIELSKNKNAVKDAEDKLAKVWKKEVKEKHKDHGWYESRLQEEINWIVRRIDYGQSCISHTGRQNKINAGHYHSVGSNNSLRFNLFNNWLQCESCNGFKSSNRSGYDEGLKNLFGKDRWLYVNEGIVRAYPLVKMSVVELQDKLAIARAIRRRMEASDPQVLSPEERWEMRRELNLEIGIYLDNQ